MKYLAAREHSRVELTRKLAPHAESPEQVAQVIPAKRLQSVDDVAAVIGFWMSPAGDYISGITLVADGGMNLAGPALY